MESPRIDQTLGELSFQLYNRSVHPELFQIYASHHFTQGDYEVTIWLTGCAHVVGVFTGKSGITEMICPPEQLLPKRGLIQSFVFKGQKNYSCSLSRNLRYMLNSEVEPMSANLYRHTHKDLRKMAKKRGLLQEYPQWARGNFVPFSYIDYEARAEELQLDAYHAFPEQQTILKTQSLFDLRRKRK
jgi:hypothetical protein